MVIRIDHAKVELPFSEVPGLEALAAAGGEIHWDYHGLVRVLVPATIQDAWATYQAYKQQGHRREPMPKHVDRFFWAQTVSLGQAAVEAAMLRVKEGRKLLPPGNNPTAAGSGEPQQ